MIRAGSGSSPPPSRYVIKGFTMVCNSVVRDSALSLGTRAFYAILQSHLPKGTDMVEWSQDALAREAGIRVRSVRNHLQTLEEHGLVRRHTISPRRVRYQLLVLPDVHPNAGNRLPTINTKEHTIPKGRTNRTLGLKNSMQGTKISDRPAGSIPRSNSEGVADGETPIESSRPRGLAAKKGPRKRTIR